MFVHYHIAAKILGYDESPTPYRLWDERSDQSTGLNFAVAGSGALEGSRGAFAEPTDPPIRALSNDVTDQIVYSVRRLQDLGVSKVLVNSVPPIGCQPWQSVSSSSSSQFGHKFAPCCANTDPNGYCGQDSYRGGHAYTLCFNLGQSFYWDYIHPTQAAWRAVMKQLQDPIQDFL
ncbi:hypothetical protein PR202_gb23816 [Eleusine coracana subsp. coracana]|uniref:GDSL esterase/lipase n=1 Tax=Eleusine coracana subsp. coracana TaxID=191504 RepID=A0AAV5FH73_ELECO|nr:hypothetical protein PR202_gb23816 [Eleusine coracana subsp. coracana]